MQHSDRSGNLLRSYTARSFNLPRGRGKGQQRRGALQLLHEMRGKAIVPNTISCSTAISASKKGQQWRGARRNLRGAVVVCAVATQRGGVHNCWNFAGGFPASVPALTTATFHSSRLYIVILAAASFAVATAKAAEDELAKEMTHDLETRVVSPRCRPNN